MKIVDSIDKLPERLRKAYEHRIGEFPVLRATSFIYDLESGMLYFDASGLHHALRVPAQGTSYYHTAERRGKSIDKVVLLDALHKSNGVFDSVTH